MSTGVGREEPAILRVRPLELELGAGAYRKTQFVSNMFVNKHTFHVFTYVIRFTTYKLL